MESRIPANWPWVVIAIVLGIGAITLIAAATAPSNGYYGMMGNGAWGWGILMLGVPALILILLVVLLAVLGAYREPTVFHPAYALQSVNALDALELRYARGELSRDDYLRIRGDLTRPSQP